MLAVDFLIKTSLSYIATIKVRIKEMKDMSGLLGLQTFIWTKKSVYPNVHTKAIYICIIELYIIICIIVHLTEIN